MGVKQLLGSALKNVKKIDKKQAIKKLAFLPPGRHIVVTAAYIYVCVCVCVLSGSGCGLRVITDPATTKYFNHNTKSANVQRIEAQCINIFVWLK